MSKERLKIQIIRIPQKEWYRRTVQTGMSI